jgi:hypothetical protein
MSITQRLRSGSEAAFDLAGAEIDRGLEGVRKTGEAVAVRMGAMIIGCYALLGLSATAVLALQPVVGLTLSMLIVSGATAVLALVLWLTVKSPAPAKAYQNPDERVASAKARLADAIDPPPKEEPQGAPAPQASMFPFHSERLEALVSDPKVLAGMAVALVGLLGPGRVLSLATRGAGAASAIATVTAAFRKKDSLF